MLNGKNVVVTGGGRGIGRGITEQLLEVGASVLIAQRQALDAELQNHPRVYFIEADLASMASPGLIAQVAQEQLGGVDVLVNNAGFMFEKSLDDMTEEDWDRMMAVNLRAPAFLCRVLVPQMRQRGGGSIINIGSIEGIGSNPEHAAYCASKAGLHGLTRALAVDLGRDSIRCNAIAPGWINSELSDAYLANQADPHAARQALLRLHPVGRTGMPADIGRTVVFLASESSAFITGQVLVVDGGRTAKLQLPF
ncbi:SDR family NAD(P)-dependent oxidoreductase [Pseudomonas sp. CT11-2]|uniref:SDR family NAD(P)-dependent oxidoreductase n=1 Tax=Pseudomonas sp. CT11-2 TaxID=3243023 RepID=UPI0039B00190